MIDDQQLIRVRQGLPVLQGADTQLVREFQQAAFLTRVPAGRDVFLEGDRVDAIALLISGIVRVYNIGETGREITLYRFGNGESCILTANAILSRKTFPAIATVEKEAEAVMIPAEKFRDWVRRYDPWREFVFDLLSERLSTVMAVVDEVVFQRMDRRVAALLLDRSKTLHPIRITHQEIAAELGSSREVISRILEDFSQEGLGGSRAGHGGDPGRGWAGLPRSCVTLSQTTRNESPTMGTSIQSTKGDFEMKRNLSNWDRIIRVVVAALFVYLYFSGIVTGGLGIVLLVLGAVFAVTAIVGYCPLYTVFKFSTFKS